MNTITLLKGNEIVAVRGGNGNDTYDNVSAGVAILMSAITVGTILYRGDDKERYTNKHQRICTAIMGALFATTTIFITAYATLTTLNIVKPFIYMK